MGKKFVMDMRERMGTEGFYGEPGYEFIIVREDHGARSGSSF